VTFSKLYISVIYKFLRQLYFAGFGSFAIFAPVKARWKVLYSKQSSFFYYHLSHHAPSPSMCHMGVEAWGTCCEK
jgi:hypothetical protein